MHMVELSVIYITHVNCAACAHKIHTIALLCNKKSNFGKVSSLCLHPLVNSRVLLRVKLIRN